MTGIYRLKTKLYDLTDTQPIDIQKTFDSSLSVIQNTNCFLGDILVVCKKSMKIALFKL